MGDHELPSAQEASSFSRTFEQPLSEFSTAYVEAVRRPDLGMSATNVGFGQRITKEELDAHIGQAYGPEAVLGDVGFSHVYRTPEQESPEQAVASEFAAVKLAVDTTLANNGWKPEDVDAVFVGAGAPPVASYAQKVQELSGLSNATIFHDGILACNSGIYELSKALGHRGKKALVVAAEGMTRLAPGFDPREADPISRYVFSNAVVAWTGVPGESLTIIPNLGETFAEPDRTGALAGVMLYEMADDEFFQENERVTKIRLPQPPPGYKVFMRGVDTTKMFLRAIRDRSIAWYRKYEKKYGRENLQFLILHYASRQVVNGIIGAFQKEGIVVDIPSVVPDGNASSANTMKALTRLMRRMRKGQDLYIVSIGAGISGTLFFARVGNL
ncbi:hypothetical protein HYV22_03430 [Candidatus Gottesmanbacteria bacterium]|nr:hypothetical protein [Candidatus Gottesmanbacteria bacterium]